VWRGIIDRGRKEEVIEMFRGTTFRGKEHKKMSYRPGDLA
jgi:hypothetical protein